MEVERTPLPGPPWVHLRTSGRNALDGTISKRFNLFICAVKKGKRNEPGTMTATFFTFNFLRLIFHPTNPTKIPNPTKHYHQTFTAMSFIWKEQEALEKAGEHPKKRRAAFKLLGKVAGFIVVLKILPFVIDIVSPLFTSTSPPISTKISLPSSLAGLTPSPPSPSV